MNPQKRNKIIVLGFSILLVIILSVYLSYYNLQNKDYDKLITKYRNEIFSQCAENYMNIPEIIEGVEYPKFYSSTSYNDVKHNNFNKDFKYLCEIEFNNFKSWSIIRSPLFVIDINPNKINVLLIDRELLFKKISAHYNNSIIIEINNPVEFLYAQSAHQENGIIKISEQNISSLQLKNGRTIIYFPKEIIDKNNIIGFITKFSASNQENREFTARIFTVPFDASDATKDLNAIKYIFRTSQLPPLTLRDTIILPLSFK